MRWRSLMVSEYRRDYVERHGITILEQSDREVLVGRWKPLPDATRRQLESFHGKPVITTPVDPDDPAIQLAIPAQDPETKGPDSDPDHDQDDPWRCSATNMGNRRRNLPPGEQLVRRLITTAAERNATDLSLWRVDRYQWRCCLRVSGELRTMTLLDERAARTFIRLIKLNARLDPIQSLIPQDGRVEFPWLPGVVLRVATLGDGQGESLALRFLQRAPRPLATLGFDPEQLGRILTALNVPAGLVFCCGPTGSGKTTTTAALAEILARNGRKVVSVEDPVEYRVPGVLQLESGGADRDYLPAALRQDPDVLWIGEIRRRDHIQPLAEAIFSGHLVLTTVHAADTEGAVARLEHLGMPRGVTRQNLVLSCTQRLEGSPPRLVSSVTGTYSPDRIMEQVS